MEHTTAPGGAAVEREADAQSLQRERELLRRVLDRAPMKVFLKDRQGRYIFVNETMARYFGTTVEQMVGTTDNEYPFMIASADVPRLHRQNIEVMDTLRELHAETVLEGSDGGMHWFETTKVPMPEDDGSCDTVLFVAVDVTERRAAERALRDSEARFSRMFGRSTLGLFQSTLAGRPLAANEAFARMFGYASPAEYLASVHDTATALYADPEVRREFVRRLREHEGPLVTETLLRRSAGDVFWARTSAWIVDDEEGGEPIVEGFVEDVTEHKLSVEALRESEERLRSVVSAMAEGMLLLDPEGTLLAANAAAEALLGLEVDPYSGGLRFPVDLEVVGRGDAPLLREERPAFLTLRTGEPQIGHLLGIRRGVGAPLSWLSVNSQPLRRHGESEPYAAVVTFHDLTAWMRAEEERDRLREQLLHAQKMESVGRLAGGVAHDFNNMLGVILGRTELALESVTSDDPLRENLVEIQQAAQRSADLTSQLLAFARKQFVAPRLLDLNETVAGTLKMLRRLIGEDIEVRWQPSLEPMPVWIDPTQVDQILANLAVNARDAIDGVGMITIGIRTARLDPDDAETHTVAPGDYVVLAVSDTGHGIDSQTLDHLFEPFFTTKAHGKGTGLGLATVYGIVMQNQGFVEVESAAGRETTFRVWLPRATEEREAQAPGPRPPREVRGSETVMLVEDEPAVLRFAATVLRRQGYTVLTAPGPIEALLAAEMHPGRIDLLVTDVIMPLMDGKELADRLQASVPSLRCLFTSGYTADVIVPRGVVDDGVSFLQKPFLPAALAESVRAVLDA